MKLKSMQLENIRSHTKTLIEFNDGFNCLVGGLGQGKSSVLYALDFVLFGDPLGRSYDYLLREDAEKGKITVVFVQNGKTYKLQRALQRREKSISQDIDKLKFYRDGKLIASNKNDAVAEELQALTGLNKNIFREVIWVRQEHLKELLDITPRQRQKKLDDLFGLSNYELAWNGLQLFQKTYEVEKSVLERDADVIRVNKLEEDYNNTIEDFSYVTSQIDVAKEKFAQAESTLHEASVHLQDMEELRKTTETLQRRLVQLQTNMANLVYMYKKLEGQAEADRKRLGELENLLKQMETQERSNLSLLQDIGWDSNNTLEDFANHLLSAEEQLRTLSGEQEATRREMNASMTNISSIITESKCPRCLQELTGDYKKHLREQLQNEQTEQQKRLTELQIEYNKLETLRNQADKAVSNLQQLIPRIDYIKKQVIEKQDSLNMLSTEIEKTLKDKENLQKQLDETQEEIVAFDISKLESARKFRDDAVNKYSMVKYELENVRRRKKDLALRIDELKEQLDNIQNKVVRKEKIGRLLEIIGRIRSAYRSIQPKLRREFITYLKISIQQVLDSLVGDVGPALIVKIDDSYSPSVNSEEGYERDVTNLSGGERTLLAFAYRIGLGQLIMQSRTGHGLYMLLLDEPTESLGREDGSVERLAEEISRLKTIEQIISVTHNEAFAEKAEHVIRIEKQNGVSHVYIEK